jgi:hypothetical protein
MSQVESYRKFLTENLEKSCFSVRRRLAVLGGALLFLGGKVYKRMFYEKFHCSKVPELAEGPAHNHLYVGGILRPLGL